MQENNLLMIHLLPFFFVSWLPSIPFPVLLWPVDHSGVWAPSGSDTALAAAAPWFPGLRELPCSPCTARSPLLPPGTLASVPASQAQCPFSFSLLPSSLCTGVVKGYAWNALEDKENSGIECREFQAGSVEAPFNAEQNCRVELSCPSLRCSSVSAVPVVQGDEWW